MNVTRVSALMTRTYTMIDGYGKLGIDILHTQRGGKKELFMTCSKQNVQRNLLHSHLKSLMLWEVPDHMILATTQDVATTHIVTIFVIQEILL